MLSVCEKNGWQKPSAYQGDYNLVTRGMETKLLPILRAHGMSFVAFRYVNLLAYDTSRSWTLFFWGSWLAKNWLSYQHAGGWFSDWQLYQQPA